MLRIEYGFEAVGLFYCILEILASQEKPVSEKVLKSQLNIKKRLEKQLQFMYKIGILCIKNGDVFNENLLNFSEKYQIKKEKTRKKVSEWREKQIDKTNVTSYKKVRNRDKDNISKVKLSKVNEKENRIISYPFDSENFKNIWNQWKEYKAAEFSFYYKSSQSEQAALMELSRASKDENQAIEIIKQSMANGWKGFFELKKDKNGTKNAFANLAQKYAREAADEFNQ